jgi:catechol 2,3-dioxygenase-like lactoylglutathione lyase family enzyme
MSTALGIDKPLVRAKGISHVAIPVSDLDRSVRFYQEVFGYDVFIDNRGQTPSANGLITVIGLIGGLAIELVQPAQGRAQTGSGFCVSFAVEDIEVALEALRTAGYSKAEAPGRAGGALFTLFNDPDNNVLEVIQLPRAASGLAELAPLIRARQASR